MYWRDVSLDFLGRLLEPLYKSTWEEYLQTYILDPLEMTNSGTDYTPDVISQMAQGYFPAGITNSLGWQSPDGQMYSTARDMTKFASLLFRTNVPLGSSTNQILDGITIA